MFFFYPPFNFPEDKDHCTGCFSHVKHGAALSGLSNWIIKLLFIVIESLPFLLCISLSLSRQVPFFSSGLGACLKGGCSNC